MIQFQSPRKTAALGFVSEYYLRHLIAKGECPGIYSGNRFLVNVDALLEKLEAESRAGKKGIENG